jgi:geranylgeranyl diphosphate synthase type II
MRREQPAVWSRYGKDIAISTGDLLISAAYMAIAQHPHPAAALGVMHNAIVLTIGGQTQDCRSTQPSPEKCATIAAHKSGPLLALPIRLALIAADVPGQEIAVQAGFALAVAYQTLDDIADRCADYANDATNICLALEAVGHSEAAAHILAVARARTALKTARCEAGALPNGVGAPLLALADRLETRLKDLVDAT